MILALVEMGLRRHLKAIRGVMIPSAPGLTVNASSRLNSSDSHISRGNSVDSGTESDSVVREAVAQIVQTKLTVAEIIRFIMDVRRDYRITAALSWFKRNFPCDDSGELSGTVGLSGDRLI